MTSKLLWRVPEGERIKLKEYDPSYTAEGMNRKDADKLLEQLGDELNELQELLYAAQHQSVLIILQGMDTSGKDGTIRHVLSRVNPQGCAVHSFKTPTEEELAHDFLWRVHKVAPRNGVIGIFNRSHYEDVLIVRVHDLVPKKIWETRYDDINQFEQILTNNNTIVLKFFLHISYEEQEQRLLDRVKEKDKAWKISASDFSERKYWNDYQQAYEDILSRCSTDKAPWYIVPANRKWYRNIAIAQTLVETLRKYKDDWQNELEERGRQELAKIKEMGITATGASS